MRNVAVLRGQRRIEPELRAQVRQVGRRRRFSEHRLGRIARHQVDQQKHQRRDAQQHRNGEREAAKGVAQHAPR